jgi:hypothetical protein
MTTTIDTPLTRLKRMYEAELAAKDEDIYDLKMKMATVRGINDLLKFELLQLEMVLKSMRKSMDEVEEHVRVLKLNLPEIDR